MKKILLFAFLLCSFSAFAQYPAQPTTKQELGRQTTGDGLIYRGSGAPAYTPSNNRNAWIYYDTTNNRLYKSRLGAWSLMVQDTSAFNEIQMPYIVDDTLYLTGNVTGEPLTRYVNRVWPIANLSDTTSITGENQGDVAIVASGDTIAFRGSAYWNPFSGGGGGGSFTSFNIAGDSGTPQTITDGNTATFEGGFGITTSTLLTDQLRVEIDSSQVLTASAFLTAYLALSADINTRVQGSGTANKYTRFLSTGTPASIGDGNMTHSATGPVVDANLAYRITGGTTASRPTGAAGMMYWNTSNGWFDLFNGTSWFNPARSASATGLGTATRVPFYDGSGLLTDNANMTYTSGTGQFSLTSTTQGLRVISTTSDAGIFQDSYGAFVFPGFVSRHSRGTTSSPSGTLAGDYLTFFGGRGTTTAGTFSSASAGYVGIIAESNFGATSANGSAYMIFATTAAGTSGAERMRITGAGNIGIGTSSPDRLLHSELSDAVTNAIVYPLRLTHITSGTAAAGSGAGLEFEAESAGGTNRIAGTIENPYTTATNAAEVSDLVFRTMNAGTLTESLRSLGNGTLQIANYTGTANGIAGKTSAGILTTIPEGYGINLTAGGALEADTTQMATQSDLAVVAASVAAIPTPVFGKFTGTTDSFGQITITLSATPATGACTCTNNAGTGSSFRYIFSARHTSGTSVQVSVFDADAFTMLNTGSVDFSIICY